MRNIRLVSLVVCLATWSASEGAREKPRAPSDADCLGCHSDSTAKRSDGRSIFVEKEKFSRSVHGEAGVACVDCHTGFDPGEIPHKAKITPVPCASCHSDVGAKHPFHPEIARAEKGGEEVTVDCQSCHGGHDVVRPSEPSFRFHKDPAAACGSCHEDNAQAYRDSNHGRAHASGVRGAPDCLTCHRQSFPPGGAASAAARKVALEGLCLSCHLQNPQIRALMPSAGFIRSFETSVHGRALARGDSRAPTCIDCHGAHRVRRGLESGSSVNKLEIQRACAKCHADEAGQWAASVHGRALARGLHDAPTCTDCHGEHNILPRRDPNSPVAAANISARVCTPCHGSLRLTQKFNLPTDRTQSYADSFHGLDARGGVAAVANCASCHGSHDILPSSDPRSRVAKPNLAKTCGSTKCHPGANARFSTGRVHVTMKASEDPLLFIIATIYVFLIVGTIGGMLLHNALDFMRKFRHVMAVRRGEIFEPPPGKALYLRMTVGERLQHGLLAVSFIVLVVTGFMLRFPEAWWVRGIRHLSTRTFQYRGGVHRVAAVIMIATSVFHVGYLALTARGRQLVHDLWLRKKDLTDVWGTLRYNLGLSSEKPRYDRFSYVEKSEYWALVWGTIVMSVTGLIMWFDNTFIGLLTKLGYDVSRVIHFYEAWLATLAILVWHFYFVIFNPDAYPMNTSWITGKLCEKEMEDEHPLELERLKGEKETPNP